MTSRGERGFGLVELMVSMIVVLTVLGVTTQILMQSSRAFTNGQSAMESRNNNAAGIDMMERLIRQATLITADPDANGLFDSIRVQADWNPRDGNVNGPYENVMFRAIGGVLMLKDGTAAEVPFAEGVDLLSFTYASHNGAPLTAALVNSKPELIGMVTIAVRAPMINGMPQNVSTSTVSIRRVK